ncbi:MAG: hypothetical protein LC799_03065, partial [Actinobacteria bacterium]|nr:hypothetical protein [Actinomycetota bacterium]
MAEVQTAHTAWLSQQELRAIRVLLDEAFDGDVTDDDYEHALGGMHALVWELVKFLREIDERGEAAIEAASEVFA